jgi:hypothetical protein
MKSSQLILLDQLNEKQKMVFSSEFKEKETSKAYLWFLLLGFHYVYLNKIGTQFLYWFTLGGFFLWTLRDLFVMKKVVENVNEKLFEESFIKAKMIS